MNVICFEEGIMGGGTGVNKILHSQSFIGFDTDCECCKEDNVIEEGYTPDLYQQGSRYQCINGGINFEENISDWAI
jgi:hypothetical protein